MYSESYKRFRSATMNDGCDRVIAEVRQWWGNPRSTFPLLTECAGLTWESDDKGDLRSTVTTCSQTTKYEKNGPSCAVSSTGIPAICSTYCTRITIAGTRPI